MRHSVPVISVADARERIFSQLPRLHPKALPLGEVLGCVTSVPLEAPENVPPFANSAVDGFAVHAADTAAFPVGLPVVGTLPAGAAWDAALASGTALRIMTGAPVPAGADAIVMVEDTTVQRNDDVIDGEVVMILRSVSTGDAVRAAGSDVRAGEVVLDRFTVLGPAHLGVLASMGYRKVPVYPRARVGVLSTGDELVHDGSPLLPGQIRESNRPMLLAALAQANCVPIDLGTARDTREEITAALDRAVVDCDAIITSGGVSMGDFDLIKVLLRERAEMNWMQLAIRPAKPFAFGVLPGTRPDFPVPVFGLPGNPVSSLVSFELLARPALRYMMGFSEFDRPTVLAVADAPLRRRPDGKTHYVRVHGRFGDDGRWHVSSVGNQGSHQLAATAAANGLAVLTDGDGFEAGAEVSVLLLT
jgi:molybdenum cofactor synthesis domain-containing protein